jgi:homoserine O-acetyltransferase
MTMSLDTAIKPGTPEDDAARADAPGLEVSQAREPKGLVAQFGLDEPLAMDAGVQLAPFQIAYQTAGTLNAARSNAVLICHALTGDQHFAHTHPVTGKRGWWETLVGPGKPVDTDRYFVICSNVVGSCMGSTGPASIDPATNRAYGLDFPLVTIRDMVRAQPMLLDRLGIRDLFLCIGGSMGGMQVLQWAASYPERVFAAMPIATGPRHSAQNIAFHEVGRQAIMADPAWAEGRYLEAGTRPAKGLGVARMGAHISPTCRSRRCTASSAAASRVARPRPSRSTPTSRSRATCATRASASSSASTPTPTSTSPARWITSIWPPTRAACWPMPSRARRPASA